MKAPLLEFALWKLYVVIFNYVTLLKLCQRPLVNPIATNYDSHYIFLYGTDFSCLVIKHLLTQERYILKIKTVETFPKDTSTVLRVLYYITNKSEPVANRCKVRICFVW